MNININSVSSAIDSPIELRKMSNQAAEKGCDILGVMAPSTPMPNMTSTVVNSGKVEMGADARSFESELKSKAELAKANLTTLFNKLTTTDIKALDEENMGSLTDKEVDKVVNVVEEIKIMLAAYCKDYIPTGNVDIDEIKEVTGNAGMAAKVIKKFHASNIPATKDNVLDAMEAVKELKNIDKIDTNVKRFLIRNNMDPTIDNIYKASHSVSDGAPRDNISDEDLSKLNTQIEDIIRDSGLEANEANKNNAKLSLKEGACLNTESLMLAKEIDDTNVNKDEDEIIDIVVDAMIEGKKAIDAKLTDDTSMKDIAIESYNVIKNAKASDIIRITNELLELNISNLRANVGDTAYRSENEEGYVKNFAALEHARLTLSAGALFTMEKLGVKLDNTAITDLTCTYEKLEISTSSVINELKDTPINALGITYVKASFSIDDITKAGALVKWKAMVANETYETFGTQIRSDLGDNLRKAVNASADNILDELGYEKNKENRAAVNILAANSMELSTQNIDKMADDYKTVMNIATNLSPRMVMDMIREKINPLTSDVHLLNEYVDRYDKGDEERDSYAKFLYKLEVSGAISDEERADYIGIYRVLNNIAKDEGKSIGATVKAGENLVLENVIKHYISRRHGKVDAKIGDESGYSAGDGNMSYYTKIFRECTSPMIYLSTIKSPKTKALTFFIFSKFSISILLLLIVFYHFVNNFPSIFCCYCI